MQENEFEKRVREEIGGLRLRPSEEVWGKVEAELKRKKRRRVVFFIFLLAGLSLLGGSGYFLWNNGNAHGGVYNDGLGSSCNSEVHESA